MGKLRWRGEVWRLGLVILALSLMAGRVLAGDSTPSPAPGGDTVAPPAYDRTGWPAELVMAYPLTGTEKETLARYASLDAFLESWLGIQVRLVTTDGYFPIYLGFQKEKIDAAYLGPLSYLELGEYTAAEPVVMEEESGGRAGYHAVMIARTGSDIQQLEQGRGRILAMVNEESTSGFLIPTLYLIQTLKTTPQAFAKEVIFTGSHDAVIRGVARGSFDLGATNDIDLERMSREQDIGPGQVTVIWQSRLYPASPYAIRKSLPESLRKAFQEAMLAVNGQPKIKSELGIGGFVRVKDSDYDPVRELKTLLD